MRDPLEEVRNPQEAKEYFLQYLKNEVFHLNFYRMHMLYFVVVILIASLIVFGEGLADAPTGVNGGPLRYIDALFLCCSAMTTTGLNTINLGALSGFQQAVLCTLLIIGSVPFVSSFVVIIRRHYFRRKLADIVHHSQSGRQMVRDLEEEHEARYGQDTTRRRKRLAPKRNRNGSRHRPRRNGLIRLQSPEKPPTPRRYHHASGFGAFPWPWETHTAQRLFHYPFQRLQREWRPQDPSYISFNAEYDSRGRFRNLSEHERAELGGVEYRALELLLALLVTYQLVWYLLGTLILVPYAYRTPITTILHSAQPGNLKPGWWGFFAVVTSFSNGGLNVLNANYIPFSGNALVLIISGALTVAGNTQFPILLRLTIWTFARAVPTTSRLRQTCLFLLHHPRRCFIYLFPSKETWYLLTIQLLLDLAMWILYEVLNLGMPGTGGVPPRVRVLDGLFQATGLRTSGAYIVPIASLAPALLVAYLVTMYISSFPIVMALRQTNTYEERSVGLNRSDPASSNGNNGEGLGMHLRRQLAYDIWFQLLAWFTICVIERAKLVDPAAPGFSIFVVLFEVTSAYGTVGLSTGLPYDDCSLSGAFQTGSKLVMLAVMVRGRHRGLPLAIDRSILLPGEELMHRMDREYNECGKWDREEEREIRRDEEESGMRDAGLGKGEIQQDPERLDGSSGSQGDRGSRSSETERESRPRFEMT